MRIKSGKLLNSQNLDLGGLKGLVGNNKIKIVCKIFLNHGSDK